MNMPQGKLRPFHPISPALRIVGETETAETCQHTGTARRIMIYSHDTFGLGNIRRMLAIAERLVKEDTDVHVLVITGSPMLHSFRISPQIDFIKLPCLSRDTNGKYQVRSLPMTYQHTLLMRSQIINSAIEMYKPHLILVDKKPLGGRRRTEACTDAYQPHAQPSGTGTGSARHSGCTGNHPADMGKTRLSRHYPALL
ncbi:MAG: hypothetical protein R3F02_21305 [Thiolinea sp.]